MQGLLAMILYAIQFFFCFQIFSEERYQKAFFNLMIGIGAVLSGYAILQYLNLDPLDLADITDASGRAYGTLGHPNFLGQFLIFPIMAVFMLQERDSSTRGLARNDKKRTIIQWGLFLLMFTAILTTMNRASMLGIGVALALFFIQRREMLASRRKWKKILITVLLTVLAATALMSTGGLRSILSRSVLIKSSLPLVLKNPLFGSGPESFYHTIQPKLRPELYETEHMFSLPDRVHNELLQTLLDQGIFGLLLYLVPIGFLIWLLKKQRLKTPAARIAFFSLVAYLISVQFSFSMTTHWVMLGAVWAILVHETLRVGKKRVRIISPFIKAAVLIGSTVVFVALLFRGSSIVAADVFFEQGIREIIAENRSTKLEQAAVWNPWSQRYLYHGISFLDLLENPEEKILKMENFLQKLKRLVPESSSFELAAATVENAKGNVAAARRHYEAAIKKAPNFPYGYLLFGDFEYDQGNCKAAIPHYEKMISVAPSYWNDTSGEKARIFRKGHQLFFEAVDNLYACYEKLGAMPASSKINLFVPR
jgi:putative inorganic carbon (HCO3(-)) transporter